MELKYLETFQRIVQEGGFAKAAASLNYTQSAITFQVAQLEQKIDDMTADFRRDQLTRMRDGTCSDEACILYSELLTDFERIGDHVLNIAQELTKAQIPL